MYETTSSKFSNQMKLSSKFRDYKRVSVDESSMAAPSQTITEGFLPNNRPASPPMVRTSDLRNSAYKTRPASRMISELTNVNIDNRLRSKIIHQVARRQYDQNTTSEEQLHSFKIINALQKQQTGSISPQQKKQYGTLIKAALPNTSIDESSIGAFDSLQSISEVEKFSMTGFPKANYPRAATQMVNKSYGK